MPREPKPRERPSPHRKAEEPKKKKKFAETQGLGHILALSEQAVQKKNAHFQKLLDKEHASRASAAAARKERTLKKEAAKNDSDLPTRQSMMALLRERRRERSRERKKKRKQLPDDAEEDAVPHAPTAPRSSKAQGSILKKDTAKAPTKKRVSFG